MKKFKYIITAMIAALMIGVQNLNAYNFTENDYYIILDVQTLGTIKVHIPQDKAEFLQIKKDPVDVVNVSSGTVYGYFLANNQEYRLTFNTFDTNTYRDLSSNYGTQTYDLVINQIIETNIPQLKENKSFKDVISIDGNFIGIILLVFIYLMGVLTWLKH